MLIMCSSIYIFFVFVDLIPIYRSGKYKLFSVYTLMLTVSYVIRVLISIGIKIPSPVEPIKEIVISIF